MNRKTRKRHRLAELHINRADLVDYGANQHADIVFYKGLTRREFFSLFKNRGSGASAGSLPSSRPTGTPAPGLRYAEVQAALDRHLRGKNGT